MSGLASRVNSLGGEPPSMRGVARDSVTGGVGEQPSSPKQPFCGRVPTSPSVSYAEGTPFSPGMRKGGKRIRRACRLTRQAKSSCKRACGCISKAVRVASFLTRGSGIEKQPYFLALLLDDAIPRIACGGSPPSSLLWKKRRGNLRSARFAFIIGISSENVNEKADVTGTIPQSPAGA